MEIENATMVISAPPDSQFRLKLCDCGNDQPVYIQNPDGLWRVECLDCRKATGNCQIQHVAQLAWNRGILRGAE